MDEEYEVCELALPFAEDALNDPPRGDEEADDAGAGCV